MRTPLTTVAGIPLVCTLLLATVPAHAEDPVPHLPPTYDPTRSFAPLVEAITPAVVSIEVEGMAAGPGHGELPPELRFFFPFGMESFGPQVVEGEGSGFIISPEGLVLTNHHVVANAHKLKVNFADGSYTNAVLLGSDEAIDVALLQLPQDREWPFVDLGTSSDSAVGDWVLAVGNPLSLGITVTAGIISGKGRFLDTSVYDDYLQTDAAINPGNSGGPLFGLDGRVIAINTAIIQGANTVGFAIPIDMVKDNLDDLKTLGHIVRGYLGVSTIPVTAEFAERMELRSTHGAIVSDVVRGTPAAKANIEAGDVLIAVNDQEITDPSEFSRAIGVHNPGDTVMIRLLRRGVEKEVSVDLEERPETAGVAYDGSAARYKDMRGEAFVLGLDVSRVPSDIAAERGITTGVLVRIVRSGSPAWGKILPGDIILKADEQDVGSPEDLEKVLRESRATVTFVVMRGDESVFVVVPPS